MTDVMPGGIIDTPEKRAWVLSEHSVAHIRVCTRCKREFFSARLRSETCYMCWYVGQLEDAEEVYRDVFDGFAAANITASMTQTGGMCLAISIAYNPDYYMLLTDMEDVLSFDRDESQGWTLGVYSNDEEADGCPIPLVENEEYLQHPVKDVNNALLLVARAELALASKGQVKA